MELDLFEWKKLERTQKFWSEALPIIPLILIIDIQTFKELNTPK
jgi:hypothetical protein